MLRLTKFPRIIPARAGFTPVGDSIMAAVPDHPRSRGVYPMASFTRELRDRIIPARAGFTWRRRTGSPRSEDHPRSRGVYATNHTANFNLPGSSPLARGLRNESHRQFQSAGIIPARAGFTATSSTGSVPREDHPRSRGVYARTRRIPATSRGSSPLARGLPARAALVRGGARIIPARAGFTLEMWGDRPAICGSSPLARGLRGCLETGADRCGIIPARAGFTQASDPR